MSPDRTLVFLPCYTLDDFPTWIEEAEADDVLACWTAAWDPRLLAAMGRVPRWASVDHRPPDAEPVLGIVPAAFDARFASQADITCTAASRWVREIRGADAVAAAALAACDVTGEPPDLTADFRALGLAALLGEMLARRMRSDADLDSTGFATAAVAAARAAVTGDGHEARERLRECFGILSAARARYYPVELWLVDLVLLAETTLGAALRDELAAPTPLGIVATGDVVERLAAGHPQSLALLQARIAAGSVACCGGRDADGPIALGTPESLRESFARGRGQWQRHVGVAPLTFARVGGGAGPILPGLLAGSGYLGAVWTLFDGTPLPDPGAARIRWEGSGAAVEAVARPPVDAREARAVLGLPERIGDTLDHDHVAVITFARYAGTASRWHGLLQRIGSWSDALGTFVTPDELFRRTSGGGTAASFEPDAYPVPAVPAAAAGFEAAVEAVRDEARRIVAATAVVEPLLEPRPPAEADATPRPDAATAARPWPWRRREGEDLVLDNGLIRVEAHARTGGLLSVRRAGEAINRLSQQLAVRTTRPAASASAAWEPIEDRAAYGRMQADAVTRVKTADGHDCIESRGSLLDADGRAVGTAVQRLTLVAGLPLAVIDVEASLPGGAAGPLAEHHLACRFAWHENEQVDLLRSLHTQAVATTRSRFTAPHFVLLRGGGRAGAADIAILTGGLAWHGRTSPHVLDTIVAAPGATGVTRRLAVGVGLERPWDTALRLLADVPLAAGTSLPESVRLTGGTLDRDASGRRRLEIGLLEAAGRAGEVRITWAAAPLAARAVDLLGGVREDVAVAIEGRSIVVFLQRHAWLQLHLEFAG